MDITEVRKLRAGHVLYKAVDTARGDAELYSVKIKKVTSKTIYVEDRTYVTDFVTRLGVEDKRFQCIFTTERQAWDHLMLTLVHRVASLESTLSSTRLLLHGIKALKRCANCEKAVPDVPHNHCPQCNRLLCSYHRIGIRRYEKCDSCYEESEDVEE